MKKSTKTLAKALELLVGNVVRVHWLDSGADHVVNSPEEVETVELVTATTFGVLRKVNADSVVLVHSVDSAGLHEAVQIAMNCVIDVTVYKELE